MKNSQKKRNPKTWKAIKIPAASFKVGKDLKKAVNLK
ncbi:MAG: HU family DNA-binding protein [Candidatus Phlomobacter fragariae]